MYDHPFPPEEIDARIAAVRSRLATDDLDGIVISVPENIYYLTGLDHWGFFACHLLVVRHRGHNSPPRRPSIRPCPHAA